MARHSPDSVAAGNLMKDRVAPRERPVIYNFYNIKYVPLKLICGLMIS